MLNHEVANIDCICGSILQSCVHVVGLAPNQPVLFHIYIRLIASTSHGTSETRQMTSQLRKHGSGDKLRKPDTQMYGLLPLRATYLWPPVIRMETDLSRMSLQSSGQYQIKGGTGSDGCRKVGPDAGLDKLQAAIDCCAVCLRVFQVVSQCRVLRMRQTIRLD